MQSILLPIKEVKLNPNNPRILKDEKFTKLKDSINSAPWMLEARPIVIDEANIILGGNMRYQALKDLGYKEIYCVRLANLTEEQKQEFIIKDNVSFGEWDWELLANDWDAVKLEEWGLDLPIDEVEHLEAEEDDFEVVPERTKTNIVLGDLIEIGKHRLLCGDSTDSDQVAKLMNGELADMVFTDPPYRMEVQGGINQPIGRAAAKLGKAIEHLCDFNPKDFLNTLPIVFENKKMNAYIFCNKDLVPDYLNWAIESGYNFNILFWKKPNAIPLGEQHRPDTEYLLFFRKSAIWNNGLKSVNYSKCLEFGRENSTPHPTMKPIELISNEIQISSNILGIVVDFFVGSGSTMVAAHQLNRKCYGMELDPVYCQVIVDRMLALDPDLEVKINGEAYEPATN